MQAWTLFLVSIERGTSRRVYHRRPWLSDTSQLGGAPCWLLARPGCGTRRCRRTEARNATVASDVQVKSSTAVAAPLRPSVTSPAWSNQGADLDDPSAGVSHAT